MIITKEEIIRDSLSIYKKEFIGMHPLEAMPDIGVNKSTSKNGATHLDSIEIGDCSLNVPIVASETVMGVFRIQSRLRTNLED
jgi:hypothetical protein